jgi:hypothetical protein
MAGRAADADGAAGGADGATTSTVQFAWQARRAWAVLTAER